MSPSIWRRIKKLETQFSQKRRDLENLVTRYGDSPHPPEEDWGLLPELRQLKKLIEDMEEPSSDR